MGEKQRLFTQHNINPLKLLITPITQAPVFMSLFIGLRGMAVAPVASMKTGGMLWFTDLTVPDASLPPYSSVCRVECHKISSRWFSQTACGAGVLCSFRWGWLLRQR